MYFFGKENGIRDNDENLCGMRDFRAKEAGMRDQDPPPPFQTLYLHLDLSYLTFITRYGF